MTNTAWFISFLVFFVFASVILLSKAAQLLALAGVPSVMANQLMLLLVIALIFTGIVQLIKLVH